MILGVGTDIVQVERIDALHRRFGERLERRILDPAELEELAESREPGRFLAKRFAAKEAAAKALGTGFAGGVAFHQIRVTHEPSGRPGLALRGRAGEVARGLGVGASFLSISDERAYAVAFVTLTR